MQQREVVVTHAVRTAIGGINGSLKNYGPEQLAAIVLKAIVERSGIDPAQVDSVMMGQTKPSTRPMNVARYGWLLPGLPESVPCFSSYRACCTGIQPVFDAAQMIACGDADIVIAGGVENMSQSVYSLRGARYGVGNKDAVFYDALSENSTNNVPKEVYGNFSLGLVAEHIADTYHVTREEQDALACESHKRAFHAIRSGFFREQIVPVGDFDTDEYPRETSMEALAKLKPSFKAGGSVTAGNSSGRNDAGSCVMLMSAEKARELGIKPELRFLSASAVALDPHILLMGPVKAVPEALERANLKLSDIGLFEVNEAFASSTIATMRELAKTDPAETYDSLMERTNIGGSGISLGHPPGATGCMMLTRLLYDMKRLGIRYGVQTMCVGGGHGFASVWERI
ncbi:MAG: thiolase family protein [Clostridiales bacterium]|nr:thiolase family protein [Clostridiales bacterium]